MLVRRVLAGGILVGVLLFIGQQADAVIKAEIPLSAIAAYDYLLVGKVEQHLPERPALLVNVTEDIKGKAPFRQLPINCKVTDAKTVKENQIEPLLKRFGPDLEIVFFVKSRGKTHTTFAYTNGTWFQIQGTQVEADKVQFSLVSAEPYFRKTFKGTTPELVKLLKDHVAGTAKLPPIDTKAEPGLGPEYEPKEKKSTRRDPAWRYLFEAAPGGGGPLFGVIPTLGIGAPLMILAMLFPTVFGGVFVLFRQWMAFITVVSINSTIMLLHWWLAPIYLRGTYWSSDAALWFVMSLVAASCTMWAWRRHLDQLSSGEPEASQRMELLLLGVVTLSCLGTALGMWIYAQPPWNDAGWALTVVLAVAVLAGAVYRVYQALKSESLFDAPPLTTEGVILGTMLLGHVAFLPLVMGGGLSTEGKVDINENAAKTTTKITPPTVRWSHTMEEKGFYCSTPLLDGEFIYTAAAHATFRGGTLICLDRQTGMQKWEWHDDGMFKEVISSPCIADGKLYIGEGFHDDPNCKIYCIDAATGKTIWRFTTGGQTESSPAVVGGKVYAGAGNEGVYCLDAKEGKPLWRYPPDDYKGRLLRFCAGMTVAGDRVYCGSGVDRNQKDDKGETAVFCFDRHSGKLLWKAPSPYPIWSTPIVKDGIVFVGTGNGDILDDDAVAPGGALLCLDAESGQEKWRFKVGNGIIESPAVDAHRVYFGCRDGQVYCVDRAKGKERWRYFLDSPVIATPVLDSDPVYERTQSVFAIASGGKVCCMNPQTGDIVWTYNLAEHQPHITSSPRLLVIPTAEGYRRQLFFGVGLGGGARNVTAHRAVFYCLEDHLKVE